MGQIISYKRPDGKSVSGYLAEPQAGAGAPGVVVIQEWWGLNDQIKGVADKLAVAGYRALVPDLYRGTVTVDAKEAEHLMTGLNFADAAGQDVRGAVQYLKGKSAKVGVTGFCMGGALTILSAVNVPEADATVCWYGYPPLEYVDASKIKAPMLAHFAIDDVPFPIAKVEELEKKLRDAKVRFEVHRYKAKHAFANETRVGKNALPYAEYNPDAAKLAWQRTMEFLAKSLK
jgi:carboxymethylenebutenolidase